MLEVVAKGSCTDAHPVPLLFVHGGWHGAWCWENFLDYFADTGYRAVAVSLRGHGASPTPKPLHKVSIADYIDDVRSVADALGGAPVLIGHSLGGFVTQRYLEGRTAPAAVLVGSVPPQGVLSLALRVWRRRPSMTMEAWTQHDARTRLAGRRRPNPRVADRPRPDGPGALAGHESLPRRKALAC